MQKIRVILFDDNPLVRESFQVLIEELKDIELVGCFENALTWKEVIGDCRPDVVVMDIDMPGLNGVVATAAIRHFFPDVQVLIQTVFDSEDKIYEALRAGAGGYILKGNFLNGIETSIREVAAGGGPFSPSIARKVIGFFQNMPIKTPAEGEDYHLTTKEQDVLHYLVEGMSYKMIADKMEISWHTVNSHIKSIYKKLHVFSMSEAVSKAIHEGLV